MTQVNIPRVVRYTRFYDQGVFTYRMMVDYHVTGWASKDMTADEFRGHVNELYDKERVWVDGVPYHAWHTDKKETVNALMFTTKITGGLDS